MKPTTPYLRTIRQWTRDTQIPTYRYLTRKHHLRNSIAKHHYSMPPKEPTQEEIKESTTQDTITPAQDPQQVSRRGKDKIPQSRPARTTKQKDSVPSSSNNNSNHGDSSIQATRQPQHFRNTAPKTITHRNNRPGNNSIHSTATSTRLSFLNSQWRTHSTQQTAPTDTEDLTQAMEQLTTQDNSKDAKTTTTTGPTKSRWRTAKPKQSPTNSVMTDSAPVATRTRSHNPNINTSKPRITQTSPSHQTQRPSPSKRGMTIGFPSLRA